MLYQLHLAISMFRWRLREGEGSLNYFIWFDWWDFTLVKLEITKLSYIEDVMLWSWLHVVLVNDKNKQAHVRYNIDFIKVFEWSK
jgi:hypothetical protein